MSILRETSRSSAVNGNLNTANYRRREGMLTRTGTITKLLPPGY